MTIVVGIIILLVLILFAVRKNKHPAQRNGFSRIFSRKCPSCRIIINDQTAYCPHCSQPTGFHSAMRRYHGKERGAV